MAKAGVLTGKSSTPTSQDERPPIPLSHIRPSSEARLIPACQDRHDGAADKGNLPSLRFKLEELLDRAFLLGRTPATGEKLARAFRAKLEICAAIELGGLMGTFAPEQYKETLIFLATAGVVVPLFRRLKLSPVLGFLVAGCFAGPYGLGALARRIRLARAVRSRQCRSNRAGRGIRRRVSPVHDWP